MISNVFYFLNGIRSFYKFLIKKVKEIYNILLYNWYLSRHKNVHNQYRCFKEVFKR